MRFTMISHLLEFQRYDMALGHEVARKSLYIMLVLYFPYSFDVDIPHHYIFSSPRVYDVVSHNRNEGCHHRAGASAPFFPFNLP